MWLPRLTCVLLAGCLGGSCGADAKPVRDALLAPSDEQVSALASVCPASEPSDALRAAIAPPKLQTLDYWIKRYAARGALDRRLLASAERTAQRAWLEATHLLSGFATVPDAERVRAAAAGRVQHLAEALAAGELVAAADADVPAPEQLRHAFMSPPADPQLRLLVAAGELRCGPFAAPLRSANASIHDRNQCAYLPRHTPLWVYPPRPQDPQGLRLVVAHGLLGWLALDVPVSAPLVPEALTPRLESVRQPSGPEGAAGGGASGHDRAAQAGPLWGPPGGTYAWRARASEETPERIKVPPDAPALGDTATGERDGVEGKVLKRRNAAGGSAPLEGGPVARDSAAVRRARTLPLPLTWRHLLTELFAAVGMPYVWGGAAHGKDCSHLVQDVFARFGVLLPRNSGQQAEAGIAHIDLPPELPRHMRLGLLESLAGQAPLLLYFPGHIMVYLGTDADGVPRVVHALGEVAEACPAGGDDAEQIWRFEQVAVTGLDVGEGSARGAFIDRITRIVALGPLPAEVAGVLQRRAAQSAPTELPAGVCTAGAWPWLVLTNAGATGATGEAHIWVAGVSDSQDAPSAVPTLPGSVALAHYRAGKLRGEYQPRRLGLAPQALEARVTGVEVGDVFALRDGRVVYGCRRVTAARETSATSSDRGPVRRWNAAEETFFSAFVESLFLDAGAGPWPELTPLLRDRDRNPFALVHPDAPKQLRFRPDCADLPYFLRAYYAFERGLPISYRRCGRGRPGAPPRCGPPAFWQPPAPRNEAAYTAELSTLLRDIARSVHSGALRTDPRLDETDLYPLALELTALRPGSVYADPYGHVLVVARWLPATFERPAELLAVDGQPDATIGLRRFWPGSFLFDPDYLATGAGAGFRGWRPVADTEDGPTLPANAALSDFSLEQYALSARRYHRRVLASAQPWAVSQTALLHHYVTALEESAASRVVSVDNALRWQREHPGRVIPMPEGYAIFETTGPWEDFASPSRDMRFLISLDAVADLPESLELTGDERTLAEALISRELSARTIAYTRSDGSSFTLSLADIVARREALTQAFNPNDCAEVRWGAPEGSAERAPCRTRAPEAQQRAMQAFQPYFVERRRPPR